MSRPSTGLSFQGVAIVLCVTLALLIGTLIGFLTGYHFGKDDTVPSTVTAASSRQTGGSDRDAEAVDSEGVGRQVSSLRMPSSSAAEISSASSMAHPSKGESADDAERQMASDQRTRLAGETGAVVQPVAAPVLTVAATPALVIGAVPVAEIPVRATNLLADPKRNRIYATTTDTNVAWISPSQRKVVKNVSVGVGIHDMFLGAQGHRLFVLPVNQAALGVIDLDTFTIQPSMQLSAPAVALAGDGDGHLFVLAPEKARSILVIDEANGRQLSSVIDSRFRRPGWLAYSRAENSLYHADFVGTPVTLTRLSLAGKGLAFEQEAGALGDRCLGLYMAPKGDVLGFLSGTKEPSLLAAADIKKTIATFPRLVKPSACAFTPTGFTFFVAGTGSIDGFSTVNFARTHHFEIGASVQVMVIEPNGQFLFAATPEKILVFALQRPSETASANFPQLSR